MRNIKPEFERFISRVIKSDGCWEWVGSKYRGGYGHFRRKIDGKWKMYKTHRYSYEYYTKTDALNNLICHTCDNPSCVNPDHLFIGTPQDNHDDMRSKGRWKLIRNPKHRLLNMKTAIEIRKYKEENPEAKLLEISTKFTTSKQQVSRILLGHIWSEEN